MNQSDEFPKDNRADACRDADRQGEKRERDETAGGASSASATSDSLCSIGLEDALACAGETSRRAALWSSFIIRSSWLKTARRRSKVLVQHVAVASVEKTLILLLLERRIAASADPTLRLPNSC